MTSLPAEQADRLRDLIAAQQPLVERLAELDPQADRPEYLRLLRRLIRSKAQQEDEDQLGRITTADIEDALRRSDTLATAMEVVQYRAAIRVHKRKARRCEARVHKLEARSISASRASRPRGHAPRRGSNTRSAGSRRTSSTRTGPSGDEPPDEGDPEPVAARSRRYWQTSPGATSPTAAKHRSRPKGERR